MPIDDLSGCFSLDDVLFLGDGCWPRILFFLGLALIIGGTVVAIAYPPFYLGLIAVAVGIIVIAVDLWIYRDRRED